MIGTKVIYHENYRGITGTIIGFEATSVYGKHVIKLEGDEETHKVALRSRVKEGQIVMFQENKY